MDSEYIPVHIDTTAQVTYIEKGGKDASWLYDSWQPGWGDQSEFRIPSNDTGKYIVWQLKLKVSSTQPYHLVIEDIPETEGVEAVAFKWIGQDTKFNKPNSNNSWRWDNQEKDLEMYAYVITRVDESIYKELISGQEVKKWLL